MKIKIPKEKKEQFIDLVEWYIPLHRAFENDQLALLNETEDQYTKARDYLADFLLNQVEEQIDTFKGVELCQRKS